MRVIHSPIRCSNEGLSFGNGGCYFGRNSKVSCNENWQVLFFFHSYVIHIRPKASEGRTTHLTSHLHCLSGVCWHPVKKKIISFNSRAMCVRVHSKVPIMGLTFSVTSGLVEALTAGLLLIRPSFWQCFCWLWLTVSLVASCSERGGNRKCLLRRVE